VGTIDPEISYNVRFRDMLRVLPTYSHVPAPCCVPTRFHRASIIAKSEGNIYHMDLDRVTAKNCGCR
jgi:hypothetical protein